MILDAEREFWDAQAARAPLTTDTGELPALDQFGKHLLTAAGSLIGKEVLELGCGGGELTARLVDGGARVTAVDASAGQVASAGRLLARHRRGAEVRFLEAPAEETGLPSASFDVIVGKWILHHLDVRRAVPEVARLLKPGGRAVFYENQDRNPLLAVSRSRLAGRFGVVRMGTPTERPLGRRDIALLRRHFASVELHYPEFFAFTLLSSRVLRYRGYSALTGLDRLIWRRLPALRPLSWHVLLVCIRPRP